MGLFGGKTERPVASQAGPTGGPVKIKPRSLQDIEVVGENYHRKNVAAMFRGWGLPEGGVKMCQAVFVAEPTNKYDRNAVKVVIDGHHIGYVPSDESEAMAARLRRLNRNQYGYADARVWGSNDDGEWRARVTLVFDGTVAKEIDYAAERREREAIAAEKQRARDARDAAKNLKETAKAAGSLGGTHWTNHKPAIAEMKKNGLVDSARDWLLACATAAAAEARTLGVAPDVWPTWQLCMIYEKSGERSAAVEALDRYVAACGGQPVPDKIVQWQMKMRVVGAPVAPSVSTLAKPGPVTVEAEPMTPEPEPGPTLESAPEPGPVPEPEPRPEPGPSQLPPANWYPDPYGAPGLLRYWDGARWTDHTHALV